MIKSFETKLFIPRDTEGEQNRKELSIIREFETELRKFEIFVGVAPYDSVMKGYKNGESDLDMKIAVDSSKLGGIER